MAVHQGIYFDKEQMEALATTLSVLATDCNNQFEQVNNVFNQIKSDEIIADDSQFKAPIMEAVKIVEDAFKSVFEKLVNVEAEVESIAEEYNIAIQDNIKKSQDAVAMLAKQAAKAKEAVGENAGGNA